MNTGRCLIIKKTAKVAKFLDASGYLFGIAAAVLFGASVPAAKFLLSQIDPWLLAGLFYLSSGLGLAIVLAARLLYTTKKLQEPRFNANDYKWLAITILSGGIIAPVLLMLGLARTSASTASLLLNLETVFTALTAWFVFKEHTSPRIVFGMILIVLASFILSSSKHLEGAGGMGTLFLAGACLAWAFDNNCSRNIAAASPLKIASIKNTVSGIINTLLALILGATVPLKVSTLAISSLAGFIGYGLSLVCFLLALRHIGTARTSAYFSLAPFVGAGFSILFLGDSITMTLIAATLLMGCGIFLHLTEHHAHEHQHEPLVHTHKHVHDEHHKHAHQPGDPADEPHTHLHTHAPLRHSHPHYPDIHHRHGH